MIVELEGTRSNRSGIGAAVGVTAGGRTQWRWVVSQDSYLSHSNIRQHFGLGSASRAEHYVVRWPSGREERFDGGPVDRAVRLVERRAP